MAEKPRKITMYNSRLTEIQKEKIDIFDYDQEIKELPEEWMVDMAVVFHEFDEDEDGIISGSLAAHIFTLFRLPTKGLFKDRQEKVRMNEFLHQAAITRDAIFLNPHKKYCYYFQMIAGVGKSTISALDLQRFVAIFGDQIQLKFCDDFIDEFDRKFLSKDEITMNEFASFCSSHKIPI